MSCSPGGRRGGFTLLELASVISIIAILSSTAFLGVFRYRRHAQIADVPENLHAIVALEHSLWTGPIACPPAPPEIPRAVEAPWVSNECFDTLGFAPGERTRFQYEVTLDEGGAFRVWARGDLDGDGQTSVFGLASNVVGLTIDQQLE